MAVAVEAKQKRGKGKQELRSLGRFFYQRKIKRNLFTNYVLFYGPDDDVRRLLLIEGAMGGEAQKIRGGNLVD